ncbi:MAG: hypothetical protein WDN49_17405 [Acetobacteraceae bacterium]
MSGEKKQSQRDRFIETARQLGADEDEAAFKAKLATIAKQKPKDEDASPKGGK